MPKVSVIIPTFNCAQYLPQAIDSVLNQSYQDFEIILVNDGSTDDTQVVVDSYSKKAFNTIHYIAQENKGLACARNVGIRNAHGNYLALLDADDVWLPKRLELGVAMLDAHPEIALVHANVVWMTEEGAVQSEAKRYRNTFSDQIVKSLFLRNVHISCPTVLMRRECIDKVGMFDENLARLGCEDRDLWVRIAGHYKIKYIPEVLAYYRLRKSGMSKDSVKMLQARQYVIEKNASQNPALMKYKAAALAIMYRDFADSLLRKKDIVAARKHYWLSLRKYPLGFWSWCSIARTFFMRAQ